jgi:hypothetical protein
MKAQILGQTIYTLYWNGNRQVVTPNEDIIRLLLLSAKDRCENISRYSITSNIAAGYNVTEFIKGEHLPECWKTN